MKRLIDSGKNISDVADSFDVTELTVVRRMKLANVAPRFIKMYRNDEIHHDQLMALAIIDDHELQEKVWNGASKYDRSAHQLRQKLTAQEIDAHSDCVAQFVGVAAYEKSRR